MEGICHEFFKVIMMPWLRTTLRISRSIFKAIPVLMMEVHRNISPDLLIFIGDNFLLCTLRQCKVSRCNQSCLCLMHLKFLVVDHNEWTNHAITLLFYQIEPWKNGVTLILLFSICRNSSAPNAKTILEIVWRILEGRSNRAQPSQPCLKNCQNGAI